MLRTVIPCAFLGMASPLYAQKVPLHASRKCRRYMPKTVSNESWLRGLIRGKLGGVQSLCKASGQGSVGVPVCKLTLLHQHFTPRSFNLRGQFHRAPMVVIKKVVAARHIEW